MEYNVAAPVSIPHLTPAHLTQEDGSSSALRRDPFCYVSCVFEITR